MPKIYLGGKYSDLFATVDQEDFDLLSVFSWCYDGHGYATTRISKSRLEMMHRMIMKVSVHSIKVDHINHNTLDNRKENLRFVTDQQSMSNRLPYAKSGYKGVRRKSNTWEANITIDKKQKYLGKFSNPEDAAKAYDKEAKKAFGVFAYINFQGE